MSLMTEWDDHRMSETCLELELLVQRMDNSQKVTHCTYRRVSVNAPSLPKCPGARY